MAIPAVTGKLRKRLILDLSASMGIGVAAAYAWWFGWHVTKIQQRDNWYLQYEKKKAEES
ncbi:MAG: hypothetical protein CYPHOPRED_004224 [Cyphobasidiales sp. Tagirdzhanova-0007]|nr:MAG: hypothetical protein CYPHOPRED_004224 [Cyphobasidiales sp. Tagirdzhanova-0007]